MGAYASKPKDIAGEVPEDIHVASEVISPKSAEAPAAEVKEEAKPEESEATAAEGGAEEATEKSEEIEAEEEQRGGVEITCSSGAHACVQV